MTIRHKKDSTALATSDTNDIDSGDWNADHLYDIPVALGAYAILTNVGTTYDAVNNTRGLGRVMADFTGCTSIIVNILVRHAGSGNLTWQLFNETDNVAIGTIADAFNSAWHTRVAEFLGNMPTGIKVVRLRVLGSVATDDPVYGGAAMLIRKTS